MDKTEINAKLQYVFEGLEISKQQKNMLCDVIGTIIDAVQDAASYSIPVASSSTLGGIKLGYSENGKNYPIAVDNNNKAYVNVPWTDSNTTYSKVTSSADGLMSKEDKAKLDNIANNANNYTLPAATKTALGGIKQAATVAALNAKDEIATVISIVNTLISNLKASGAVANS